jgi:hypothetical protein
LFAAVFFDVGGAGTHESWWVGQVERLHGSVSRGLESTCGCFAFLAWHKADFRHGVDIWHALSSGVRKPVRCMVWDTKIVVQSMTLLSPS